MYSQIIVFCARYMEGLCRLEIIDVGGLWIKLLGTPEGRFLKIGRSFPFYNRHFRANSEAFYTYI